MGFSVNDQRTCASYTLLYWEEPRRLLMVHLWVYLLGCTQTQLLCGRVPERGEKEGLPWIWAAHSMAWHLYVAKAEESRQPETGKVESSRWAYLPWLVLPVDMTLVSSSLSVWVTPVIAEASSLSLESGHLKLLLKGWQLLGMNS